MLDTFSPLTSKIIINSFCDTVLKEKTSNKIFPNVYIEHFEADILEFTKSGYVIEYEVKVSRSDFLNEGKKKQYRYRPNSKSKYEVLQEGKRVNRFYYIVPQGLITVNEVPEFAGLIYARQGVFGVYELEKGLYDNYKIYFDTIKSAPLLDKQKLLEQRLPKCMESMYYRFHKNRIKNESK